MDEIILQDEHGETFAIEHHKGAGVHQGGNWEPIEADLTEPSGLELA